MIYIYNYFRFILVIIYYNYFILASQLIDLSILTTEVESQHKTDEITKTWTESFEYRQRSSNFSGFGI